MALAEFTASGWRGVYVLRDTERSTSSRGAGILHHPQYPRIEGLARFGEFSFSTRPVGHDVAVDEDGFASSAPASTMDPDCLLSRRAPAHVKLFQRSAQWDPSFPNPAYPRLGMTLQRGCELMMDR